jgi:predicted metal-dependent peptidase
VIVVDTSGSIGTQELEQFAGEINAITNEAQPECQPERPPSAAG